MVADFVRSVQHLRCCRADQNRARHSERLAENDDYRSQAHCRSDGPKPELVRLLDAELIGRTTQSDDTTLTVRSRERHGLSATVCAKCRTRQLFC